MLLALQLKQVKTEVQKIRSIKLVYLQVEYWILRH